MGALVSAQINGIGALLAVVAGASLYLGYRPQGVTTARRSAPRNHLVSTQPSGTGPTLRLRAMVSGAGALVCLTFVSGAPAWVLAAATAGVVWNWSRTWETSDTRRRRQELAADLPAYVTLVASGVATGSDPTRALGDAAASLGGQVQQTLATYVRLLDLGEAPDRVWLALARTEGLEGLGRTLLRCARSGAPIAESLHRLANDLVEQRQADAEVRVRQVAVKVTLPLAGFFLPAFVCLAVIPMVAGSLSVLGVG